MPTIFVRRLDDGVCDVIFPTGVSGTLVNAALAGSPGSTGGWVIDGVLEGRAGGADV